MSDKPPRRTRARFSRQRVAQISGWIKSELYQFRKQSLTVYFVARDNCTPLLVRGLALAVAAYAFSPIDLIPDFIPVLGYLDDLILVALGLAIVLRFTPAGIRAVAAERAKEVADRPVSYVAAVVVAVIWCLTIAAVVAWGWR